MVNNPANYAAYQPTLTQQSSAVAPAAGVVIVDVGDMADGLWQVIVETSYGGVADVIDNMELWYNGVKQTQLTVIPVVNVAPTVRTFPALRINKGTRVQVKASAAGAANTVYRAALTCTPIATLSIV